MKVQTNIYSNAKPLEHIVNKSKAIKPETEQECSNAAIQISDIVEISSERKKKPNNVYFDFERLREQLKSTKEQAKAEADAAKIRLKCQEIARRIMNGDKVPREDHSYLLKNDPAMYMQATSFKMQNENPKEHKRLSEDEETKREIPVVQINGLDITSELSANQSSEAVKEVDLEG